jgi:hypothetical protein
MQQFDILVKLIEGVPAPAVDFKQQGSEKRRMLFGINDTLLGPDKYRTSGSDDKVKQELPLPVLN